MKSISLYVDKWFITVAVNIDGNVRPLRLPNGEDRIWLYFFEDTANNRVDYGKCYERNYRDKEPHYFGDIFPLIESGDTHFTRYDNRPEDIKDIFKVSNIFNHLHQAVGDNGEVDAYISFSTDISDVARLKLLQEFEDAGFKIIESVARISHLALEEGKKRGLFSTEGQYLVMVATNDNLHYSLYCSTEGLFVYQNEDTLRGYGFDVRRKALVEAVVENVNRTTHFLSLPEDIEKEQMRQDRFADDWLDKIASRRFNNMPVILPNVTFAVAPNNPYSVTINPADLDNRTNGIVANVVQKIADFVRGNNVQPYQIRGIVFIGNTFTNQQFAASINNRFVLDSKDIAYYLETELPKVVSVYSEIDCGQFKAATAEFVKDAKTQETLARQAKEEEARKKAAEEEARRQQESVDQQRKAERDYTSAIDNVERCESERDYEEMCEWAEIALTHKPDDQLAKEKLQLAQQLLAEQRANKKQFDIILQRTKTAFAETRWHDAASQADIALELNPSSDEAKRIKREALRQLDIKEKVKDYLDRASLFFAQKLYAEALAEVEKVYNLDADNAEADGLKAQIANVNAEHERKVAGLVTKLNVAESRHDYQDAISVCDMLIDEDAANLRRWTEKKERLRTLCREIEQNRLKLAELRSDINKANFNDDWQKLLHLCETYLSIEQDKEIAQFLSKAKKKCEELQVKNAKEKAIGLINSLIIDRRINEAEAELRRFEANYPSEYAAVKDIRTKLFAFEPNTAHKTAPPRKKIGFSQEEQLPKEDGFFDAPHRNNQKKTASKKSIQQPSNSDFFNVDKSSTRLNEHTRKSNRNNHSNEEFNF